MNVCILSMQRVNNFGSLLQSYSLKRLIESMGHQVSFIDIEPKEEDDQLIKHVDNYNSVEREGDDIVSKLRKIDRYALNRLRIKNRAKQQDEEFERFRTEILNLNDSDNLKHYDLCVIGSDEVFNCYGNSPWGFTSQLFGNVRQADRVITYAASCGSTKIQNIPEAARERMQYAFSNVCGFSVRDKNTAEFVKHLTSKHVVESFDPVIFGNFNSECTSVEDRAIIGQPYCIVYSYYNRIHTSEEINLIKDFAREKGLKIVSVGAPQYWINTHLVLSPFEMITVFRKASFVITDTFHGTIFSFKYANKYAIIMRDSNKNKLEDLILKLGIEKHLISNNSLNGICDIERNDERVRQIEELARNSATEYLGCYLA